MRIDSVVTTLICLGILAQACFSCSSSKRPGTSEPDAATDADTDVDTDSDTDLPSADDFGNGSLVWAVSYGNPKIVDTMDTVVLPDDSVVSISNHRGDTVFGLSEPAETLVTMPGIALSRHSSDGSLMWAKNVAETLFSGACGVDASSDEIVYFAGAIQGEIEVFPGEPEVVTVAAQGIWDAFLASISSDGEPRWVRQIGGAGKDMGWDVAASEQGVVVVGEFEGALSLDDGDVGTFTLDPISEGRNLFVAMYSSEGDLEWARAAGELIATSSLPGDYMFDRVAVATPDDGSVFVSLARYSEELILGPGEDNETVLPADAEGTTVLARFHSNGDLDWARVLDGIEIESINGLAISGDGSIHIAGSFEGEAVFGVGEPNETTLSCGTPDTSCGALARYMSDGELSWVVRIDGDEYSEWSAVDVDEDGNIGVAGFFSGDIHVCSTVSGGFPLFIRGALEMIFAKYDYDGVLIWAEQAGSNSMQPTAEYPRSVGFDTLGSLYVSGTYSESAWFGILEPEETVLEPYSPSIADHVDTFLSKYEP